MRKFFMIFSLITLWIYMGAINLEQACEIGLKNNLDYRNTKNVQKNATVQKYQAYSNILPQTSVIAAINRQDEMSSKSYGYKIEQPIFQKGKIYYGIKQAENNETLTQNNTKLSKLKLLSEIEKKYYNALRTKTQLKIAKKTLQQAKADRNKAEIRYKTGNISKTDFLNFQLNVSEKENTYLLYQNNYEIALENLANYLNTKVNDIEKLNNLATMEEIDRLNEYSKKDKLRRLNQLLQKANNTNINLKNSKINIKNSRINLKQSRLSFLPSVSLSAQKNWTKNEFQTEYQDSEQVGLNFSLALFPLIDEGGNLIKNKHNLENSKNEYKNLENAVNTQIKTSFYNMLTAAKSIKTAEISIDQAESLYEESKIKYKTGKISANDLLKAAISLENAKFQYADNFYDFLKQKANLKQLIPNLE